MSLRHILTFPKNQLFLLHKIFLKTLPKLIFLGYPLTFPKLIYGMQLLKHPNISKRDINVGKLEGKWKHINMGEAN